MTLPTSRSSGDPTADRRYAYAMEYRAAGDLAAAAELVAQALELTPQWAAGWFSLGDLHETNGVPDEAVVAYRRALAIDAADMAGARARLARLGAVDSTAALAPAHIAALFDDYAPRFERALVGGLAYRGPALLRGAVDRAGGDRPFGLMVDLGCGTGLAAEAFANICERMDGVDLSAGMLAIARQKGLYAALAQEDVAAHLAGRASASADLVLAADVLVYMGDLAALFSAVAAVLKPGGLFAFTVQHLAGDANGGEGGFALGSDLRYAHSAAALRRWTEAVGLRMASLAEVSTRLDAGRPVPGLAVVAQKP